jgi:hypothetical protein
MVKEFFQNSEKNIKREMKNYKDLKQKGVS